MSIFASLLILACAPPALLDFAIPRWQADQSVRIEDSYKWLYQATRGGEHAVPDRETAQRWLDNEWSSLTAEPKDENEWVPLCPGGEIGRLNLRPFKAGGGKANDLLDAFLISAREYRGEPDAFTEVWAELGARLKRRGLGEITYKEWLRLDAQMKNKGYPAIHHSESYNKARRPAYRILTRDQARRLIPS